jgi:hypothetical protein
LMLLARSFVNQVLNSRALIIGTISLHIQRPTYRAGITLQTKRAAACGSVTSGLTILKSLYFCVEWIFISDRLRGPVVRVSGYRSKSSGFDSRRFRIFWEATGLEQGPLSVMRTTEELLDRKSSGSDLENRD